MPACVCMEERVQRRKGFRVHGRVLDDTPVMMATLPMRRCATPETQVTLLTTCCISATRNLWCRFFIAWSTSALRLPFLQAAVGQAAQCQKIHYFPSHGET